MYTRLIFLLLLISVKAVNAQESYRITSKMELLKPLDVAAMTTDAQSVQFISETDKSITVLISTNPNFDQLSGLKANANWKLEYGKRPELKKYLDPGLTTNWDEPMKQELLSALAKAGINPEQLSDVELVKKVSSWVFFGNEFSFQDHFISYDVDFANGSVQVIPELKNHFQSEKIKNNLSSDEAALNLGIFGKSMFQARKYGNCTMSATLLATVLKALGIPTRFVLHVPAIDWNDNSQWTMVRDNIHHFGIRKKVLEGISLQSIGSWGSHTFNEVFIGNKWVRLNYANLGQTPADNFYFGLMLQVGQYADWSEANLGKTWGTHAQYKKLLPFPSYNPYRSLEIKDTKEVLNSVNNPEVDFPELKVVRLEQSFNSDSASIPSYVRENLKADPSFAVKFNLDQPSPDFRYIAMFRRNVSREFIMRSNGYPDIRAFEVGSWTTSAFTALKIKPNSIDEMVSGVEYTLIPISGIGDYRWETAQSLKFIKPKGSDLGVSNGTFTNTSTILFTRITDIAESKCPDGNTCITLVLNEPFDLNNLNPVKNFLSSVSRSFRLVSSKGKTYSASLWGISI